MKSSVISKSVSVGKKGFACWPGAQSVAKEQQKTANTKAVKDESKK